MDLASVEQSAPLSQQVQGDSGRFGTRSLDSISSFFDRRGFILNYSNSGPLKQRIGEIGDKRRGRGGFDIAVFTVLRKRTCRTRGTELRVGEAKACYYPLYQKRVSERVKE